MPGFGPNQQRSKEAQHERHGGHGKCGNQYSGTRQAYQYYCGPAP